MNGKIVFSTCQIVQAPIVGEAIPFSTIKNQPGIYRLNDKSAGSAALAVMKDGKVLYVNNEYINDDSHKEFGDMPVWRTSLQAPDEITL